MKRCVLTALLNCAAAWSMVTASTVHAEDLKERLIGEVTMYRVATGEFAPVYPALARQILEDYDRACPIYLNYLKEKDMRHAL